MQSEARSLVTIDGHTYCLKNISKSTEIVQAQATAIRQRMSLDKLSTQFQTFGKWVRIAFCGVAGNLKLELKIRDILLAVDDLCNTTIIMLNKFEKSCERAQDTVEIAFTLLEENLDTDALNKLIKIKNTATTMRDDATKLVEKCETQRKSVNELVKDILVEGHDAAAKQSELENQIGEETQSERFSDVAQTMRNKKVENIENSRDSEQKDLDSAIAEKETLSKEYKEKLLETEKVQDRKLAQLKQDQEAKRKTLYEVKMQCVASAENQWEKSAAEANRKFESKMTALRQAIEKDLLNCEQKYEESSNKAKDILQAKLENNETELKTTLMKNETSYKDALKESDETYKIRVDEIDANYNMQLSRNEAELDRKQQENKQKHDNEITAIEQQLQVDKKRHWFGRTTATEDESRKKREATAKSTLASNNQAVNQEKDTKDANAMKIKTKSKDDALQQKKTASNDAAVHKEEADTQARYDKLNQDKMAYELFSTLEQNDAKNFIIGSNKVEVDQAEKDKERFLQLIEATKDRAIRAAHKEYEDLIAIFTKEIAAQEAVYLQITNDMSDEYQKKSSMINIRIQNHESELETLKSHMDTLKEEERQAQLEALKFADKIVALKGNLSSQEDITVCLQLARNALEDILNTVKGIRRFWTEVLQMTSNISESDFTDTCTENKLKNLQEREKYLNSTGFKKEAAKYVGKWVAIKDICIVTNQRLTYTQNEVRRYVSEAPNHEEAKQLADSLKSLGQRNLKSTDSDPFT